MLELALSKRCDVVVQETAAASRPTISAPPMMQSCASESWRIRSPSPIRWPITVTKTPWPETITTESSVPRNCASSASNSRWSSLLTRRRFATEDRDAGAVALDRGLRGFGDARVAGEAQVVVAGPVDHRAPADDRGVVGHALVHVEIGVLEAEGGGG